MCGIAGLIDPKRSRDEGLAIVGRMCAAMVHRGPDDEGVAALTGATIGMRRLAIFDPANGQQPMRTPDGRLTLVFNGAIYNYRELRAELAATWSFRTECDTEVLLAAYARWGGECVRRLRGMFAFAVWNESERTLFLARDPLGIKPFYYRHDGATLAFASELNALLAGGTFAPSIDPGSVNDYLGWLAVPAPRTIYHGVLSLEPGQCATFASGQLDLHATWNFSAIPRDISVCGSAAEFTAELARRLDDTIRAHVLADVPVGAFLSGGLDSTAVVGLMTRATGARLRTFSVVFDEAGYSEANAAAATARHFGTDHTAALVTGADVARDLDGIVAGLDQPSGDGINTYYASRAAHAGGVKVALSGLGGDELFGGYPSFSQVPRLARWLPAWRAVPAGLRTTIVTRLNRGDTRRRKLGDILSHATSRQEIAALQRRVFSDGTRASLLTDDARTQIPDQSPFHPRLHELTADLASAGDFELASGWELRTYMTDVLLRDSDAMSMRHSLELRVPFVDRPLIEWLWRQPSRFKSTPAHPKSALAAAVGDLLPPGLADRPKRGFTMPFAVWMKRDLRPFLDDTFTAASIARSGLFEPAAVQQLWRGFLAQDDVREWSRVWSLAIMLAFVNRSRG
jgi:asparagine synthase (glutamine-hydrolysing)